VYRLIEDIPSLEVKFLRFHQESLCLVNHFAEVLEVTFAAGLLPEFDKPCLGLRVFLYDPFGDSLDRLACR
jgi:hypothetical protein